MTEGEQLSLANLYGRKARNKQNKNGFQKKIITSCKANATRNNVVVPCSDKTTQFLMSKAKEFIRINLTKQ